MPEGRDNHLCLVIGGVGRNHIISNREVAIFSWLKSIIAGKRDITAWLKTARAHYCGICKHSVHISSMDIEL